MTNFLIVAFSRVKAALGGVDFTDVDDLHFMDGETCDAREAGSRYTRGNIPTQHDSFITSADLEYERKDAYRNPLPR